MITWRDALIIAFGFVMGYLGGLLLFGTLDAILSTMNPLAELLVYLTLTVLLIFFGVWFFGFPQIRSSAYSKGTQRRLDLIERLAAIEHEQWISWSKEIARTEKISKARLARWKRSWIPYDELPANVKEFDKEWARKALDAVERSPRRRWSW